MTGLEEVRQGVEEARENVQQWHTRLGDLRVILADIESYSWACFAVVVGENLPKLDVAEKKALVRLSILLQTINGGVPHSGIPKRNDMAKIEMVRKDEKLRHHICSTSRNAGV
jgi:hypothetical protein